MFRRVGSLFSTPAPVGPTVRPGRAQFSPPRTVPTLRGRIAIDSCITGLCRKRTTLLVWGYGQRAWRTTFRPSSDRRMGSMKRLSSSHRTGGVRLEADRRKAVISTLVGQTEVFGFPNVAEPWFATVWIGDAPYMGGHSHARSTNMYESLGCPVQARTLPSANSGGPCPDRCPIQARTLLLGRSTPLLIGPFRSHRGWVNAHHMSGRMEDHGAATQTQRVAQWHGRPIRPYAPHG